MASPPLSRCLGRDGGLRCQETQNIETLHRPLNQALKFSIDLSAEETVCPEIWELSLSVFC